MGSRTGKFRPGITFTLFTNQFQLPKNGGKVNWYIKRMAFKKWNTNFRLEHSVRKNWTSYRDVPLFREIFR